MRMGAQRAQSVAELGDMRHLAPGHGGRADTEADSDADGDGSPEPGTGEARQEVSMARGIRAQCLADGLPRAEIALTIHSRCEPTFGTTLIRAHRLALGIALADVVAQVRARYASEGRMPPRLARRCCPPTRARRSGPGRSTCTTCAVCTRRSRAISATRGSACAAGRTAPRP